MVDAFVSPIDIPLQIVAHFLDGFPEATCDKVNNGASELEELIRTIFSFDEEFDLDEFLEDAPDAIELIKMAESTFECYASVLFCFLCVFRVDTQSGRRVTWG